MARKDGFSTNAETLADFRDLSRQVFVAAYEREIGENMHPGFQDKPLTSLYLSVTSDTREPELGVISMTNERMVVQPIDGTIVDRLDAHPYYQNLPDDVKERYGKIGAGLSAVALSKELVIANILPMEAVDATYATYMSDDTIRTAGIFMEKPDKMRITAAKCFAAEVLKYVQSDSFVGQEASEESVEQPSGMSHVFWLDMEPDLPLNGFEDRGFLTIYRREMVRRYNSVNADLQKLINKNKIDDDDREMMEQMSDFMETYKMAVVRADRILMSRNDYE